MKKARRPNHRNQDQILRFRLYVTDEAASSMRAVANLRAICDQYFQDRYELEIIDTLTDPLRAMQDGIAVTPTLVKWSPEPAWTMVGDLSEEARVLAAMRTPDPGGKNPTRRGKATMQGGKSDPVKRRTGPGSPVDRSVASRTPPARSERARVADSA